MSLFTKKDHLNDTMKATGKKDNRVLMVKTKIPTDMKTHYSTCPRCSKVGYIIKKGFCVKCKFRFTPNKPIVWQNGRKNR